MRRQSEPRLRHLSESLMTGRLYSDPCWERARGARGRRVTAF